ncbi:MAG: hypothetical protein AAGH40_03655 [Verrucomicrobiota bacterium]
MSVEKTSIKPRRAIIEEIKALFKKRQPLNISAVKRNHPELIQAVYAQPVFWGWKNALEDAGIDYDQINTELADFVTCKICGQQMKALGGLHLEHRHNMQPSEYVTEFPQAEMRSEEQRQFKSPAKLIMPHWELLATAEYTLDRIAHFNQSGIELNQRNILLNEPTLVNNAMHFFGSWDEVLIRVGLEPSEIRHSKPNGIYSKEYIISEFRRLYAEGHDVSYSELKELHGTTTLCVRAIRVFGSYTKALKAAGIDPTLFSPYAQFEETYKRFDRRMKAALKRTPPRRDKAFKKIRREFENVIQARYKNSWQRVAEDYKF